MKYIYQCIYINIDEHERIYAHIETHIYAFNIVCFHNYTHLCSYMYIYIDTNLFIHNFTYTGLHTHTYIYIYRYTWYPPVPTFELPLLVFTGLLTGLNVWSLAVVSRGVPYVYINIHIYCNLPKSTEDHISLIFPVF